MAHTIYNIQVRKAHPIYQAYSNKWLIVLLFLLFFYHSNAVNKDDSLIKAKTYIQVGKYKKAERMLSALHTAHPDDLNILWLYAQSAYLAGHNKRFNETFELAIKKYPANYYLKLDYALKLVENGDVDKALPLLEKYQAYDHGNMDLKLAYAKIHYWQGEYMEALDKIATIPADKQTNNEVLQLKYNILNSKSPWVKANCNYLSDDQPLKAFIPKLEGGNYYSSFLSPTISVFTPYFMTDSGSRVANALSIGNKLSFFKQKASISANTGFINLPNKTNAWTGSIELSKTSFKYLHLYVQASRKPYLTTLSSLDKAVVPYYYSANASWNNYNSWNGTVMSSIYHFKSDNNYVYTIGGWAFTPPLKLTTWMLRLGYAYGYSTSKINRFVNKSSFEDIVVKPNQNYDNIPGVYDPYFTPLHQKVHSVLLNMSFNPGKKLAIGANASLGFLGTTENPYLFLDKEPPNTIYLHREYSLINFYPKEVTAYVLLQLTRKILVKADYSFLQNNFYTSHTAGLTFRASFWHEK